MANFVVLNLSDSGPGSLRDAITQANSTAGADNIFFQSNLVGQITLTSQLVISDDVIISGDGNGDGRADITISGGGTTRIFKQTGSNTDVDLISLTLTAGNAGNGTGSYGGAVFVEDGGSLDIIKSTLSGNSAYQGGGIFATNAAVYVRGSLVADNTSTCRFSGGGIYALNGSLTLNNTTVDGNASFGFGGGIGAVSTTLSLTNSTITNNRADADGNVTDRGGGVVIVNGTSSITNCVIADNTSGGSTESDIHGTVDTAVSSVFGTTVAITNSLNNLLNVAEVGLGPLALHGGATATRNIVSSTSFLLDRGSNAGVVGVGPDANGAVRIQGGTVDIGATESNVFTVTNLNDSGAGSLRAALTLANASDSFDKIIFQSGLNGTITLTSGLVLSNNVSINGDTNGDGEFDITLTDGGNDVLLKNLVGVTSALTSVSISGAKQLYGVSALQNGGTLSLEYCVLSGNVVYGGPTDEPGVGPSSATVFNTGNLFLAQSLLTSNFNTGGNGRPPQSGPGRGGGDAASIINKSGGNLVLNGLVFEASSARGGNGSSAGISIGPGLGFYGGNGGDAAGAVLNEGAANGGFATSGLTAAAGSGGSGGFGNGGLGPNGAPGAASTTNLNFGSGTLIPVLGGNQNANTVSNIGSGLLGIKFYGLGGADNLTATIGNILFGGTGNDTLTSSRYSKIYGGMGNDTVRNTYLGGTYSTLYGGKWDGGSGIDTFDASLVTGNYFTGTGALTLNLATGANNFLGNVSNFENIIGTDNAAWSDVLTGDAGVNNIQGLSGNDTISGGGGADTLNGGTNTAAGDTLSYEGSSLGVSINLLTSLAQGGDAQGDIIANFENITGSAQGDQLIGDNGANLLRGGTGNDLFVGGLGADTMIGGGDLDVVDYSAYATGVFVNLTSGTATGGDIISEIENIIGSAFGDVLDGDNGANTMRGGAGNDFMVAGNGADLLIGGADNDEVSYATATTGVFVNLTTGVGANGGVLQEIENIRGSNFGDVLQGDNGANTIRGLDGNDFIIAGNGADLLIGGNDNDTVSYETATSGIFANLTTGIGANGGVLQEIENLTGSNFGDVLIGSALGNTLKGGGGNDYLVGNAGSDALYGGADNDTFRFETTTFGNDVIVDFQDNGDKLSFAAAVATNFSQFTILNNNTTNVTVQIAGQSIVVQGVANISLTAADFLFV